MQKLGQHFLKNKNVAVKIIDALALRDGDAVFEIGPGHGELTLPLAAACRETGCFLAAIEKDPTLADKLSIKLKNDGFKNVEAQKGDALKQLPLLVSKYRSVGVSKYLLVGNIPYYITGHLLRVVSELDDKPERSVFMVQKEVAERIAARPPKMNRLAASVQFWAEPKTIANVPKNDFRPAPKVDSAIILLSKKDSPAPCNADNYYAAVRILFGQPRKTILNNVTARLPRRPNAADASNRFVSGELEKIGIDPKCRPQNLSVENIADIAKTFFF